MAAGTSTTKVTRTVIDRPEIEVGDIIRVSWPGIRRNALTYRVSEIRPSGDGYMLRGYRAKAAQRGGGFCTFGMYDHYVYLTKHYTIERLTIDDEA